MIIDRYLLDKKIETIICDDDYSINDCFKNFLTNTSIKSHVIYLPKNPEINDYLEFQDVTSSWNINPLIIDNSGNMILGSYEKIICDVKNAILKLKFVGGNIGWMMLYDVISISDLRKNIDNMSRNNELYWNTRKQ